MTGRLSDGALLDALAVVAPGKPLREGLDRILQAKMGALIVVGDGPEVLNICSGGFLLDAAFSPQRLSELAKMDGAIILAPDASRIARANVHLVPNPNVPTSETGTRHRTAERVARSIDVPVISVSEDMGVIAVYVGDREAPARADPPPAQPGQPGAADPRALQEPARRGVRQPVGARGRGPRHAARRGRCCCSAPRWCCASPRRSTTYIVELGVDGRLVRLQLEELMGGVGDERRHVVRDYLHADRPDGARPRPWPSWPTLDTEELLDLKVVAEVLHLPEGSRTSTSASSRAGYRLLSAHPPAARAGHRSTSSTGSATCHKIMRATIDDLDDVEGVGETRARAIKEGLFRLAESSILDRFS